MLGRRRIRHRTPPLLRKEGNMEFITLPLPAQSDGERGIRTYLAGLCEQINHTVESLSVASGQTRGWSWRRYPDGTAECWRQVVCEDVDCTVQWGAMYESEQGYGGCEYPFEFAFRPTEILSVSATDGSAYMLEYPFGTYSNTQKNAGRFWLVRPSVSRGGRAVVDICVKGRIKK